MFIGSKVYLKDNKEISVRDKRSIHCRLRMQALNYKYKQNRNLGD